MRGIVEKRNVLGRPQGEVQAGADEGAHAEVDPEEGLDDAE